jgi:exocyst complex component 2
MNESAILSHYKINSLYPDAWPTSKEEEDSGDDGGLIPDPKPARINSKGRFSVLEPKRTSVPGAERTKDGLENLVQKDEPDPFGGSQSVVQTLRRQGVSIDTDGRLSAEHHRLTTDR